MTEIFKRDEWLQRKILTPKFNHSREDSILTPCPTCEFIMTMRSASEEYLATCLTDPVISDKGKDYWEGFRRGYMEMTAMTVSLYIMQTTGKRLWDEK